MSIKSPWRESCLMHASISDSFSRKRADEHGVELRAGVLSSSLQASGWERAL
jgi:hypothetical protein